MNSANDKREQLGDGVIYKDIVPLGWREIGDEELAFSYLSIQDSNEEVLRFIATLDEFHADAQDEHGTDLARIEFKINLLLDMVTRLVVRETAMPDSVPITLGSAGIEWISQTPPEEGQLLELSLYLHHKYPRPFKVIGRVTAVLPVEKPGGNSAISLSYETMSSAVQTGLDKLIFRQHRRSVAQSRRVLRANDRDEL